MESLKDILLSQLKRLRPSFFHKKPHFNFISAHYLWIIGLSLLGSIIMYFSGRGNIDYIDALCMSTCANSQAGLNTVDANLLNTFQQALIYFLTWLTNPISINSFVVFLRLYWFEKRFQSVVRDARSRRGTISKSKSKAKPDSDRLEKGVNARDITVMHNGNTARITNDGILLDPFTEKKDAEQSNGHANGRAPEEEDVDPKGAPLQPVESRRPEIKFAQTVKRSDGIDDTAKLPAIRLTDEDHIAILQRQRNQDNEEVLRIPGPRDAERGMLPKRVTERGSRRQQGDDDDDDNDGDDDEYDEDDEGDGRGSGDNDDNEAAEGSGRGRQDLGHHAPAAMTTRQQAITIEEPEKPRRDEVIDDTHAAAKALSPLKPRIPRIFNSRDKRYHHEEQAAHAPTPQIKRRPTLDTIRTALTRDKNENELTPYLSWEPTLGRNSAFPDLTAEQREELGGIEYRSLKTLALILVCYLAGFTLFGIVGLVPWIVHNSRWGPIVDAAAQGRAWWGVWTAQSAFFDLGLTLTPDSMNSFNTAIWPLLLMSFLIVIGNTGFPVMLRFIIWILSHIIPKGTGLWEELRFLLDHPRRCFTLLFPSGATWWLFWLLVILNGLDLIFFIVLDLGSGPVSDLPPGIRVLDGLFQAFATRTAGFSVVNIGDLHPGVQTSYLIMMYISVFPIAISVRRTNVYEEKSLGIYSHNELEEHANITDLEYVGAHLRRQLSFDLWYIFVGFFILSISEGPKLQRGDFSMFAVLFEVVSAYGTVGLSLGYPGTNASLCAQFSVVGKLVIIGMQIRGRHRGLPYGLDRAILLPSESLNDKETEDANARMTRRPSNVSLATEGPGSSARRGRSRSIDRVNSNLITRVLHPGPPIPRDHKPPAGVWKRSSTQPRTSEDLGDDERLRPVRSGTAPSFRTVATHERT
ncbi:uncharacterized protein E0L32_011574 [Thyridium curvatum]|uniref:Potassium transport protein n=1 Tax=Thyridium curvatum TaxID=1093900 RepID=A0A507BGQ6_9PEZI|nr:uncharacterized protein E0L32_011574 [Thyridium curvatum]TPX18536.1 hypothetical protein E0L32_011574 [Thyridium curvatum]